MGWRCWRSGIKGDFAVYLDQLHPLLLAGLKEHAEYSVCCVAVVMSGGWRGGGW